MKKYLKKIKENPLISTITMDFFYNYKNYRRGKVRTDTVNKELRTFQTMFQMGVDCKYALENVVAKI